MALLNSKIDSLSLSYEHTATRGIWSFLKKIAFVAVWDATGAVSGVGGAVVSSLAAVGLLIIYETANNTRSGTLSIPIRHYVNDSITALTNVIPLTSPTSEDSIGLRHNALLHQASRDNCTFNPDDSLSTYVAMFDSMYTAKYETTPQSADTASLQMMVQVMTRYVNSDFDMSKLCLEIGEMFPRNSDEIAIMETYISNLLTMTIPGGQSYTVDVLSQIDNSSNDAQVKLTMRRMVLTAYASTKLWNLNGNAQMIEP